MNTRKVAAQFAAYAWYEEAHAKRECRREAALFARDNWTAFLPVADEGWGRLLIQVLVQGCGASRNRARRRPSLVAAG